MSLRDKIKEKLIQIKIQIRAHETKRKYILEGTAIISDPRYADTVSDLIWCYESQRDLLEDLLKGEDE